jgi:hypothetical protein
MHFVCIIGNAPSAESARAFNAHLQAFPSIWAVWKPENGQPPSYDGKDPQQSTTHFMDLPNSTWAQGIAAAYEAFEHQRRSPADRSHPCEYYFVVDDDARFSALPDDMGERLPQASVEEAIVQILHDHRPALLSFPWESGLKNSASLRRMFNLSIYTSTNVLPLTGFDNGNIIYHHSLMPFLLPFAPHHEGMWHGDWTLPATWLQLFLPRMYRNKAMVARRVVYSNEVNLNKNGLGRAFIDETTGLATHEGSRHPYEWPLRRSYTAYLASGLKQGQSKFGADMGVEDMGWSPNSNDDYNPQDHNFTDFLERINTFYDVLHPAVRERPYIKNRYTRAELLQVRQNTPFILKLFVFTVDRLEPLQRLLNSLLLARYDLVERITAIDLTILVDVAKNDDDNETAATHATIVDYVRTINWPHGRFSIRVAQINMGLKRSIMEAWLPTTADEFAVFLEDDIEVSPYFAYWIERTVKRYYYGQDRQLFTDEMMGISLYAPRWSQVRNAAWSPEGEDTAKRHEPYILQLPCSWGAVYFPRPWMQFLLWYRRNNGFDPLVPNLVGINRWPHERSWKKYLVRYMVETGSFMLYPHLPKGLSLSTNHMEMGSNDLRRGLSALFEQYAVPLLQGVFSVQQLEQMLPVPALESLRTFDIYEQSVGLVRSARRLDTVKPTVIFPDIFHLPIPTGSMKQFSKFTIVVPSYGPRSLRLETFIRHYEALPSLDRICVVWNEGEVPHLRSNKTTVQVLQMARNDLNNRFIPHTEIETSAVLSLDDDVLIDVADVEFAFYTWQMNPRSIIGFRWTTRGYAPKFQPENRNSTVVTNIEDAYTYQSSIPVNLSVQSIRGYHLALTGAAFMHLDYLKAYSSEEDERMTSIRQEIRRRHNCEDIAMNLLVAESTGNGPIIVEGAFNKSAMADGDGLWKRPGHYEDRSQCIGSMVDLFGSEMCLKNVVAFPQSWQEEWISRPRVPPPRNYDIGTRDVVGHGIVL